MTEDKIATVFGWLFWVAGVYFLVTGGDVLGCAAMGMALFVYARTIRLERSARQSDRSRL